MEMLQIYFSVDLSNTKVYTVDQYLQNVRLNNSHAKPQTLLIRNYVSIKPQYTYVSEVRASSTVDSLWVVIPVHTSRDPTIPRILQTISDSTFMERYEVSVLLLILHTFSEQKRSTMATLKENYPDIMVHTITVESDKTKHPDHIFQKASQFLRTMTRNDSAAFFIRNFHHFTDSFLKRCATICSSGIVYQALPVRTDHIMTNRTLHDEEDRQDLKNLNITNWQKTSAYCVTGRHILQHEQSLFPLSLKVTSIISHDPGLFFVDYGLPRSK